MITKEERKKLKKLIGFKWIARLNKYFVENKIYNRYNDPYTSQFISLVFNGKVENPTVEAAIWDFAELRKQEEDAEQKRRKAILKDVKTDEDEEE